MPPEVIHVKNATKIAAALSNEKCQRILEHLQKHEDATESELAKKLALPLSTVHYNMKVLTDAKLVLTDTWSYSVKGKTVTHYRVNENPIVLVQENTTLDALKALVPAGIIAGALGASYWLLQKTNVPVQETADVAQGAMMKTAIYAAPATDTVQSTVTSAPEMLPAFLAGVLVTIMCAIIAFMVIRAWNSRVGKE